MLLVDVTVVDFCSYQFVDQEALKEPVFDEKKDEEKEIEEEEEELGELYINSAIVEHFSSLIAAIAVVTMISCVNK